MQTLPPYPPNPQPYPHVPQQQPKTNRKLIAVVLVVLALLLVGGTVAVILLAPSLGQALVRELDKPKSSGPSAPWPALLDAAQQEAAKVDKEALLAGVDASPVQFEPVNWTYSDTLELTFRYTRPNGDRFTVTLEDSAPTSTIEIGQDTPYDREVEREYYRNVLAAQQERKEALASVQITPRDAVQRTWQEAMTHADEEALDRTRLAPALSLEKMSNQSLIYWHVYYRIPTLNVSRIFEQALLHFYYEVSAEDGTILKRGYEDP
jgi:hypothetical protein